MSVALLVPELEGSPERIVPIATDELYSREWMPVADRLGLTWLKRFHLGVSVGRADLDEAIGEFLSAGRTFAADGKHHLGERASVVVETLRDLARTDTPNLSVFIG